MGKSYFKKRLLEHGVDLVGLLPRNQFFWPMPPAYTHSQLKARGWTDDAIGRHLPEPCLQGERKGVLIRVYRQMRVHAIEAAVAEVASLLEKKLACTVARVDRKASR